MKHAFIGRSSGVISIHLSEKPNNVMYIEISDNGVGLPKDFSVEESDSLGMKLIGVISNQLNANFMFDSSHKGTSFSLTFKKEENKRERP